MRLKKIELSGFRGARESLSIPFGSGFTIITGRNGSGKSSVCDAIEFIFTGGLSRFSASDVEGGERISDYIWWRDGSTTSQKQVKAIFESDDGKIFERIATPDGITPGFQDDLLYDANSHPPDPLTRLCQTAIIRDESITRFSTDLAEADRFDFFYKAIGLTDLVAIEQRAHNAHQKLRKSIEDVERQYAIQRERVAGIISEISQVRVTAAQADDIDLPKLRTTLSEIAGLSTDLSLGQMSAAVQRMLADLKHRTNALELLKIDVEQLADWRKRSDSLEATCRALEEKVSATEGILTSAEKAQTEAGDRLKSAQVDNPKFRLLAQLKQYGSLVGLQEGRCPLCNSIVSEAEFSEHLQEIDQNIQTTNAALVELTEVESARTAEYSTLKEAFQAQSIELSRARSELESVRMALRKVEERAEALGVTVDPENIDREALTAKKKAADLDKGLLELQASVAGDRVAELEKQRNLEQKDAETTAGRIEWLATAARNAKSAEDTTKRVSWEAVDECLAALSPLLSELYYRLKPHADYSEIRYRMRGDVKRFLSFAVGQDINPRFTFSSGQRRALGLAFLLAVHLSRPWCNFHTLILDDPVQHIDDYRALHLAEVLSSIRQLGHQVICTVEDPGLADLLCRRLRSSTADDGIKIELEYEPGMGSRIKEILSIGPLPERILLSA
jgi:DNA repair exonuclease SbcCD ATPase subunit